MNGSVRWFTLCLAASWPQAARFCGRLLSSAALSVGLFVSPWAHAGGQVEEPLANAVRTALSAAVSQAAPPVPVFASEAQKQSFEQWASTTNARLLRHKPDAMVRREFLQTVWYEAKRAGLDPGLVMGLIEVESGFRKYAISSVGARGYMQVMPFWARSIGTGDAASLFHMQSNLRFGCVILRHYLDVEKGNLFLALGRYNGSRGRAEYPNAVAASWRRWALPGSPAVSGTQLAEGIGRSGGNPVNAR